MADEAIEELDSQTEPTEEVVNTEEVEETPVEEESEDLSALQEQNKKLFERAKKAEAEAKILKAERIKKEEQAKVTAPEKQDATFDLEDVAVLVQKVSHKQDREIVKDYAKFKGISLEDALNTTVIQGELKKNSEERTTAEATNTSPARRGSTKQTDEQILSDAAKGKDVDPEALAEAHFNSKFK